MTLKEAYEIQRKEVWSLRAENKRLAEQAAGTMTAAEKEKFERHIRYLEGTIKTKDKRYHDMYECLQERCRRFEDMNSDLSTENSRLNEQVERLTSENAILLERAVKAEEEVLSLLGMNRKLEKKLGTNFENSSLPSSSLPFRKKIPNGRKSSGRKPGAQPGHIGHSAEKLTATREPVIIPVPDSIKNDPDCYPTGKRITKQLIDINISVSVTDYVTEEYRNRRTGARVHAPFPGGIVNDVNYGPSVKAFAFLLNNYYNVSIAKTQQCISDITRGIVAMSTGAICGLSSHFSAATEAERARIFSLLTRSDILYSDATVSNVNGARKSVILCTDSRRVIYQHLDHKGHEGLDKTPVSDFKGTLIHDHDRSYYSYGSSHQECLAHVLRYLIGAIEIEPELKWHRKMHGLLQEMIHAANIHRDGIPRDRVRALTERYDSILELASSEYSLHPPDSGFMDGFNLQKRLRDFRDAHLFFLTHPGVSPTNNISERGLRKFKRKQKQAVVLRSNLGGRHICDALTIIETARLEHKNIYDTVEKAFLKN